MPPLEKDYRSHPAVLARQALRRIRASMQNAEPETVDNVVEIGGEATAALLLISMAFLGTRAQPVTYGVRSESHLTTQNEPLSRMREVLGIGSALAVKIQSDWHNTYHHDKNGDKNAYWAEPKRLGFDHNQIETTAQQLQGLEQALNNAASEPIFDLSRGDSVLDFPEQQVDRADQRFKAIGAYALVAGLLAGYEEITAGASEILMGYPIIDPNVHIKRRTFLKVTGAIGACVAIDSVQRKFIKNNKHLLGNIQSYIRDQILPNIHIPPDENFNRFFGMTPEQLRELYKKNIALLSSIPAEDAPPAIDTFHNDGNWSETRKQLLAERDDMQRALAAFDAYLHVTTNAQGEIQYTIPADLNDMMMYGWATNQITSYVDSKKAEVDYRHLINAGVTLLGFAAAAALSEGVLFPLSDQVVEKLSSNR